MPVMPMTMLAHWMMLMTRVLTSDPLHWGTSSVGGEAGSYQLARTPTSGRKDRGLDFRTSCHPELTLQSLSGTMLVYSPPPRRISHHAARVASSGQRSNHRAELLQGQAMAQRRARQPPRPF